MLRLGCIYCECFVRPTLVHLFHSCLSPALSPVLLYLPDVVGSEQCYQVTEISVIMHIIINIKSFSHKTKVVKPKLVYTKNLFLIILVYTKNLVLIVCLFKLINSRSGVLLGWLLWPKMHKFTIDGLVMSFKVCTTMNVKRYIICHQLLSNF